MFSSYHLVSKTYWHMWRNHRCTHTEPHHTYYHLHQILCLTVCYSSVAPTATDYIVLCLQKGFPVDCTLDSLMEFFEKHGKIDSIFMRRNKPDKTFKGSVFVTFSNMDEEKIFLEKDSIKYNDTELIKMTK